MYNWNGGSNPKLVWSLSDGFADQYCNQGLPMTTKPSDCEHYVVGGTRYLNYPTLGKCCNCCDSGHGCGVPAPTFLDNAVWIGTDNFQGVPVNMWVYRGFQYMETLDPTPVNRNWVGTLDLSGNYYYTFVWNMVRSAAPITLPAACGGAGNCKGICNSRQLASPSWDQIRFD